jgi:hypothetical protein
MWYVFSVVSLSDDDDDPPTEHQDGLFDRIFHELKSTQSALKESRNENRDILTKLTKKLSHFRSLALSVDVATHTCLCLLTMASIVLFQQKDYNLDRYRNANEDDHFQREVVCARLIAFSDSFVRMC